MPSRNSDPLYSTTLVNCTSDADHDLSAFLNNLTPIEETDEEIVAGIDAMLDLDAPEERSSKVTETVSGEVITPQVTWSSKVTGALAKSLSSKVTRRFRSSIVNDLQTIQKIKDFGKSLPTVKPVPLVAISNPSKTTPLTPPKARPTPSNDNSIPVYEKGRDLLKLTMANEVLETSAAPVVSWTLDITPDKIRSALSHSSGFTSSLADDLKRALMRELGREALFWFHVDISNAGHLHLHGAIDANTQEHAGLERALRHVGGHMPISQKEMVHLNPQRCDQGWVRYAMEARGAVRKVLGKKASLYTISRPLRREAADLYSVIREVVNGLELCD